MNLIVINILVCRIVMQFHGVISTSDNDSIGPSSSSQHYNDDIPGEPLSPLDFKNAEKLSSHNSMESLSDDPIEKAGLFEGDINMNGEDYAKYTSEKNAIRDSYKKWTNGTVPYLISSKFNERERSVIARAVLEFQRQTCITFTPRASEQDYIMITTGNGCSSHVGRAGGQQSVTLGNGCIYTGIVMHELMHTVGFWHEQSRWDRDDYVVVYFDNIQPGMEENFKKISWKETQNLNASYDTSSIMHYGPYAFSKNKQRNYKTIAPKVSNDKMGQRVNFSETDVYKINKLYKCNNSENSDSTEAPSSNNSSYNAQKCEDNHHNCQKWASAGECQKNPNWMLVNCKQSCNQCSSCSNSNKHCEAWAANGECSKNPGYMKAHCSKACKQCR